MRTRRQFVVGDWAGNLVGDSLAEGIPAGGIPVADHLHIVPAEGNRLGMTAEVARHVNLGQTATPKSGRNKYLWIVATLSRRRTWEIGNRKMCCATLKWRRITYLEAGNSHPVVRQAFHCCRNRWQT
jgi:hypothetical protein